MKVLCLLGLFTTTYAYISTCTDLSWESEAKREKLTLYNSGNHILVVSSTRFNCFGHDGKLEYTNKSLLLNPGQSIHLPGDAWMSNCSVTLCSACLMHHCNIITQLNPNATVTFLYNASDSAVDFSAVGYTDLLRKKKFTRQYATAAVCPSDIVSAWKRKELPIILIDIPNRKKRKTFYTVQVQCNGSYLQNDDGMATDFINYTTPVVKRRGEVSVIVKLQALGNFSRTCTMKACLHRKKFCKQKILCMLTIPDNSVRLRKLSKRKKPQHKSVGCSQTQWVWSVLSNQTGNLNLKLRNKDWHNKSFRVSVRCKQLSTLNDSVLLTIPPMVHEKLVTFPLTISKIKRSATSTKCTVRLCNLAKRKCGRNTKCSIALPVNNGKFIVKSLYKIEQNNTGECKPSSVVWSYNGPRRGVVAIKLSNSRQESILAKVSLNCSELDIILRNVNLTIELPPNSLHFMELKVKPNLIDNAAVETTCTVKICNNENCDDRIESCITRIPVENGLFVANQDEKRETKSLDYKRETSALCPSDVVFFNRSSNSPTIFVNVENTKKNALPFIVKVICNNINVIHENGTVSGSATKIIPSIQPKAQKVVKFTFQDNDTIAKACALRICLQRTEKCTPEVLCGFTFLENISNPSSMGSNSSNDTFKSCNWTWTVEKSKKGIFDVILHNDNPDEIIEYNVTLLCNRLRVFNNSVNIQLIPMTYSKRVSFTIEPLSLHKFATSAKCVFAICKDYCRSSIVCNADIPVSKRRFIKPVTAPTEAPLSKEQEEVPLAKKKCTQKIAVWETDQTHRGILKVKAYNPEGEEIEVLVTLYCQEHLKPVNDKVTELTTVPGKAFRVAKFRFKPKIDPLAVNNTTEVQCVVDICTHNDCINGKRTTCVLTMPVENGAFVPVKAPRKKVKNETNLISYKCRGHNSKNEMHSLAPCHNKMWNLIYTSGQLEGEALLTVTLNLKSKNRVDLQTNVSLECEGIIIEDDAQRTLVLSKFEKQRNVSFAIATIRSLDLERHICTLTVEHSLLIAPEDNITDDAVLKKICLEGEKCSIAIDSRLGRIIPKCNFHQVKSLINGTEVDQKMAKITLTISPSVYDVFTYDAYCSKNNPFTHDPIKEKKENSFVSESQKTKLITVDYSPDCDNDTIRKEFENYRKDNCYFLLYGYCQGGELLLEKLEDIKFDHDQMYCTPKMLFNKWLQSIQKYTGIHSKPMAAILVVFVAILILLITIVIPVIIVVYFCCCRRHRDDTKRQSVGIVISSCDEWEDTNAMLTAMSRENSKFLMGKSDQMLINIKDSTSSPYDSMPDESDVEIPIYHLPVKQHDHLDHVDQNDSAYYHDPEDQHAYHQPTDPINKHASMDLDHYIEQLQNINESLRDEENSKLSVTRTEFSSTLSGWGDEHEGELFHST